MISHILKAELVADWEDCLRKHTNPSAALRLAVEMQLDPDSRAWFRKQLNEQIARQVDVLARDQDDTPTSVSKQRGVITGLGLALQILDQPTHTETPSDGTSDVEHTD
jgi:hypothetical protein